MTARAKKVPPRMTVAEFLAWPGDGSGRGFQLVDGSLRAMAPASPTHGTIQAAAVRLLENHFAATRSPCRVVIEPGVVPRVRADANLRIPDIGVTCLPDQAGERTMREPILLIEVLSPSNETETWDNVWAFTTIPSIREIVVIHSVRITAELLRRRADGSWPERPEVVAAGDDLALESVSFSCRLIDFYARTHLAREGGA